MKKLLVTFFAVALPFAFGADSAAAAQYHWDGGPTTLTSSPQWYDIIMDHGDDDGHCDNTSGDMTGFPDVDCQQWNTSQFAFIQNAVQDCGSGACTVSATVKCILMDPAVDVPGDDNMYTFTCTGSAIGPNGGVSAGNLGGGKRGVRCGPVSCGCETLCPPGGVTYNGIHYSCTSEFFGSPAMVGGNRTNYVCQ
jgi:hypothetical protein